MDKILFTEKSDSYLLTVKEDFDIVENCNDK